MKLEPFWVISNGAITVDLSAAAILVIALVFIYMFWHASSRGKLDWTDMITSRQNKVSLTKLLQLVGGLVGTWIMVFMTLSGKLTSDLLIIYLTYVGAIEGWSKFVAAKYGAAPNTRKDVD